MSDLLQMGADGADEVDRRGLTRSLIHATVQTIMDQRAPLIPGHEAILDRLIAHRALRPGRSRPRPTSISPTPAASSALMAMSEVTFAVFMRRRVVAALEPTIRLIRHFVPDVKIKRFYEEGDIVPSESKMLEITGSMAQALGSRDAAAAEDRVSLRFGQQCL